MSPADMRTTSQKINYPTAHSVFYHRNLANAVRWNPNCDAFWQCLVLFWQVATMRKTIFSLLCVFLAGCGGPEEGPEEALRAWVDAAEAYAEDKDRGGLLDMIDENYADGRGYDHTQIGNLLRIYFLRQKSVGLVTNINDISVMGGTAALVNVTVVMAGTNADAFGVRADAYNFELELENLDDEWKLIGARWGAVGKEMH